MLADFGSHITVGQSILSSVHIQILFCFQYVFQYFFKSQTIVKFVECNIRIMLSEQNAFYLIFVLFKQ